MGLSYAEKIVYYPKVKAKELGLIRVFVEKTYRNVEIAEPVRLLNEGKVEALAERIDQKNRALKNRNQKVHTEAFRNLNMRWYCNELLIDIVDQSIGNLDLVLYELLKSRKCFKKGELLSIALKAWDKDERKARKLTFNVQAEGGGILYIKDVGSKAFYQ